MTKKCINVDGAPPAVGPYSHAVVANGFVFASGQCPFAADGSGPVRGSIEDETRVALDNVKTVLEGVGSGLQHVVKTTAYLSDMGNFQRFNAVYKEYFPTDPPARTCIQAARLPLDVQVEVDVHCIVAGNLMERMRTSLIAITLLGGIAAALAYAESAADFNNQGISAYDGGNYPLAINLFEQAYEGARDNVTVRHNLCNALQAQANVMAKNSDFSNAAKQLETAIGVDPENSSPLMQLGAYYLRLDMVSDAILRLEDAIELKPGDLDAHEMLGRAYYADNDPLNAMIQWEYVLQMDPGRKDLKELHAKAKREAAVEVDFKRRGSKHFTVSYPPAIANDVRARVMGILEAAYQNIGMKFGKVYPPTPIQLVTYGPGQFEEATKLDEHVGAVFDGKIRVPLVDKEGNYLADEELKRRLTHEYVHVVIRHIAGANVPWWVNEGFAETFSSEVDDADRAVLGKAIAENKFIKFEDLQDAQLFRRKPDGLQLAYSEAQAATSYLLQHFGTRKIIAMMADLAANVPADLALKQNFGRTLPALDKEVADKYR